VKIKKTSNILFILLFVFFITSCFDHTGPMQDSRGTLPEGNYAGYIYAGEGTFKSKYSGRIGCTYEKSNYNINDDEEIELSIYYGFIIDNLMNLLSNKNVTNFNYRIGIYFHGDKNNYSFILKEELINVEDKELLDKYKCEKEIYEHQINGSGIEGDIYKYSYTSNGFLQYGINKDKLVEMNKNNNIFEFYIFFELDFNCDGIYEEGISELRFKIFIDDKTIILEGIKYDSLK
jgi:hypothetical protein